MNSEREKSFSLAWKRYQKTNKEYIATRREHLEAEIEFYLEIENLSLEPRPTRAEIRAGNAAQRLDELGQKFREKFERNYKKE